MTKQHVRYRLGSLHAIATISVVVILFLVLVGLFEPLSGSDRYEYTGRYGSARDAREQHTSRFLYATRKAVFF